MKGKKKTETQLMHAQIKRMKKRIRDGEVLEQKHKHPLSILSAVVKILENEPIESLRTKRRLQELRTSKLAQGTGLTANEILYRLESEFHYSPLADKDAFISDLHRFVAEGYIKGFPATAFPQQKTVYYI